MDWKSMCPWFNSKRYHFLLSFWAVFLFWGSRPFLYLISLFDAFALIRCKDNIPRTWADTIVYALRLWYVSLVLITILVLLFVFIQQYWSFRRPVLQYRLDGTGVLPMRYWLRDYGPLKCRLGIVANYTLFFEKWLMTNRPPRLNISTMMVSTTAAA